MFQKTTFAKMGVSDLFSYRRLVAAVLPRLEWRRHGVGILQAYVHEHPDRELRVHIWSPALVLPGIQESGSAHNHRFSMCSRVLLGTIGHAEWTLRPGVTHTLYNFKHARIHSSEAERIELSHVPEMYDVERTPVEINAGSMYDFARGAYHDSFPVSPVAVTLVEKYDQRDDRACVIAPVDKPPVAAFGGGHPSEELIQKLVSAAVDGLREDW